MSISSENSPTIQQQQQIRVVTLNILAERWFIWQSDGGFGYSNVPKDAEIRSWRRRCDVLTAQLKSLNGDIYCLQEVDEAVFTDDLVPFFKALDEGFDGAFQTTKEEYPIATAIFWRRTLMCQQWVNPRSRTILSQFKLLRDERLFYVACCHLEGNKPTFYKGMQRVNQIQSSLKLIEKHMRSNKLDVAATPLIVAGDLNACPGEELHDLLRTGDLSVGDTFVLEQNALCGTGDVVVGQAASQPYRLRSAALVANGREPAFTFIGNNACYPLDYVYVSNSVRVLKVIDPSVAFATTDMTSLQGAVPNATIPSDHLPLVADVVI